MIICDQILKTLRKHLAATVLMITIFTVLCIISHWSDCTYIMMYVQCYMYHNVCPVLHVHVCPVDQCNTHIHQTLVFYSFMQEPIKATFLLWAPALCDMVLLIGVKGKSFTSRTWST